ncbi:MAG: hypothetical protein KatS3mg083_281 [Candidatus Dojkabacteria bacterium]|nr:MAG: hypothetical protein KatS3mg083_281 [Candidatus Dojkabacteria bacterium]
MANWKPSVGEWRKGLNVVKFHDFREVRNKNGEVSYVFTFVKYNKDNEYPDVSQLRQENSTVSYIVYYFHPINRVWDFNQSTWTSDPKNPLFIREVKDKAKVLIEILKAISYYAPNCNHNIVSKIFYIERQLGLGIIEDCHPVNILSDNNIANSLRELSQQNFPIIAYFDDKYAKSNRKRFNNEVFLYPPFMPGYGDSFILLSYEELEAIRRSWNEELKYERIVRGRRIVTHVYHKNILVNILTEYNTNGQHDNQGFSTNIPTSKNRVMTKEELAKKMVENNPALKTIVDGDQFKPLYNPNDPVEEDEDVPF